MPQHIAVIMDGNGRWAKQRGRSRAAGHRAGVEKVRSLVESCGQKGIKYLTIFAFSSENWLRPQAEVAILMKMFSHYLKLEAKKLDKNQIRLKIIGDRSGLSQRLNNSIDAVEDLTKSNSRLQLNVALNYGSHWEICQAAKALAKKVQQGQLDPNDIDSLELTQHLSTADCPDPDLLIRTSGEQRLSNFLLWQLAYAELYFSDTLFPDFGPEEFECALDWYRLRQRRFGTTSEVE